MLPFKILSYNFMTKVLPTILLYIDMDNVLAYIAHKVVMANVLALQHCLIKSWLTC